jgi:hypothetical protein
MEESQHRMIVGEENRENKRLEKLEMERRVKERA